MGYFGGKLKEKKPKNLQELEKMLQEKWKKICVLDIQYLINSMPRRVAAVIAVKAGTQNVNICRDFIIVV